MFCGVTLRVMAAPEAELTRRRAQEKYDRGQWRKYVGRELHPESSLVQGADKVEIVYRR